MSLGFILISQNDTEFWTSWNLKFQKETGFELFTAMRARKTESLKRTLEKKAAIRD